MVARAVPSWIDRHAVDIGHPTAGLLDEDRRRGEVPAFGPDLDHRLGGALRHQRVAPEVAEAALAPRRRTSRPSKPGAGPDAHDIGPRAVQDLGVVERRRPARPRSGAAPVDRRREPTPHRPAMGPPALTSAGARHHAA